MLWAMDAEDEYLVQRAVECLLEDLDDDEAFQILTPEERAAALAWVLAAPGWQRRVRGVGGVLGPADPGCGGRAQTVGR
jgi:hypothetical protein